jgi:hypothetical protein
LETTCDDSFDNDANGVADCLDPVCDGVGYCELGVELTCDDGFDNDGDGESDCLDADCAGLPICPDPLEIRLWAGFGENLISLPRTIHSPPITNAEELLGALATAGLNPVRVGRISSNGQLEYWSGGSCSPCGGDCFCIDPQDGRGYFAKVDTSGILALQGVDDTSPVMLYGPELGGTGMNAISLPLSSPLQRASEVWADINASSPGALVAISRMDPVSGTLYTYTGLPMMDFLLTAGEGLIIQVNYSTTYTPPAGAGPG